MTKNSKHASMLAGGAMLLAMSAGTGWAQEAAGGNLTGPVSPPPATPGPATVTGAWNFQDERSVVDGRRTYSAILASTNEVSNSIGRMEPVYLAVRCRGRQLDFYVVWPFYAAFRTGIVQYRFDGDGLRTEIWSASSSGTAVGRFSNRQARDLVTRLSTSQEFAIRIVPDRSAARDAVFDLTGAQQVAAEALAACS